MSRKQSQQNGPGSAPVAVAAGPRPSISPTVAQGPAPGTQAQSAQSRTAPRQAQAPTTEQIRARAYEFYLARNGRGGSPESDWLEAEKELRARAGRLTP